MYQDHWVDFAHNRSLAIGRAQGKCDYIMTLDADEVLAVYNKEVPETTKKIKALPKLVGDRVNIETWFPHMQYQRTQLLKDSAGPWRWECPIHEVPVSPNERTTEFLQGCCIIPHTDGARAKDSNRFLWDAFAFEKEVVDNPKHWRAWFYLGQSYQDAGRWEQAIPAYETCAKNSEWLEERAVAYLRIGRLYQEKEGFDKALPYFWKSYGAQQNRAEGLFEIIRHYRKTGEYALGAKLAPLLLEVNPDRELLFVERSVYEWRAKDEVSICYFYTGRFQEAVALASSALMSNKIGEGDRDRIEKNLRHFEDAIKKQKEYELREGSVK